MSFNLTSFIEMQQSIVRCYMERYDQLHFLQKNRVDHTPLHPEKGKGYIPPSFHHHFGRRWRSLHARPEDTCAQNIMHASSLHHTDCSNTFSIFQLLLGDLKKGEKYVSIKVTFGLQLTFLKIIVSPHRCFPPIHIDKVLVVRYMISI